MVDFSIKDNHSSRVRYSRTAVYGDVVVDIAVFYIAARALPVDGLICKKCGPDNRALMLIPILVDSAASHIEGGAGHTVGTKGSALRRIFCARRVAFVDSAVSHRNAAVTRAKIHKRARLKRVKSIKITVTQGYGWRTVR